MLLISCNGLGRFAPGNWRPAGDTGKLDFGGFFKRGDDISEKMNHDESSQMSSSLTSPGSPLYNLYLKTKNIG